MFNTVGKSKSQATFTQGSISCVVEFCPKEHLLLNAYLTKSGYCKYNKTSSIQGEGVRKASSEPLNSQQNSTEAALRASLNGPWLLLVKNQIFYVSLHSRMTGLTKLNWFQETWRLVGEIMHIQFHIYIYLYKYIYIYNRNENIQLPCIFNSPNSLLP